MRMQRAKKFFLPQRARGNTKVDRAIEQSFFTAKDAKGAKEMGRQKLTADQRG